TMNRLIILLVILVMVHIARAAEYTPPTAEEYKRQKLGKPDSWQWFGGDLTEVSSVGDVTVKIYVSNYSPIAQNPDGTKFNVARVGLKNGRIVIVDLFCYPVPLFGDPSLGYFKCR